MRITERLTRIEANRGRCTLEDQVEAYKGIYRLMYDREPTPEEIESQREYLRNSKPLTIAEVERMVYGEE